MATARTADGECGGRVELLLGDVGAKRRNDIGVRFEKGLGAHTGVPATWEEGRGGREREGGRAGGGEEVEGRLGKFFDQGTEGQHCTKSIVSK